MIHRHLTFPFLNSSITESIIPCAPSQPLITLLSCLQLPIPSLLLYRALTYTYTDTGDPRPIRALE